MASNATLTTISNLKAHLGGGLGLRKNKYLIEIPYGDLDGEKLNILCQSAGLPEKAINTTIMWHKGRQYQVRGETNYTGSYEITVLDDSKMNLRKIFDKWMKKIDDSKPKSLGMFGADASSYEEGVGAYLGLINSGVGAINQAKKVIENPKTAAMGFLTDILDKGQASPVAEYQIDISIWQLTTEGKKIYGYKLQNAFPKEIGQISFQDSSQNELSEFTITFAYSETIPLEDKSTFETLAGLALGDDAVEAYDGVSSLFD